MMETKLLVSFCALLLLLSNLGSADHDNGHAADSPRAPAAGVATEAPQKVSVPAPSPDPTAHPDPAMNGSDPIPSSGRTGSLITPQPPEPQKDNNTNLTSPVAPEVPESNSNLTEDLKSMPQIHTTTTAPPIPPNTTTASPPHTAHSVDPPARDSSHFTSTLPPDSISTSRLPTRPKTHSSTSAPKSESTTTTTTSATAQSSTSTAAQSSTSTAAQSSTTTQSTTRTTTQTSTGTSTSSFQEIPKSQTHKSPPHTPKAATVPASSPTAQAKAHADTPSQLNVGGDTTMVHEAPTLDPLLAGLVTAFVITAVIITLLLFLKLRRRDNRPEFRRLQDLPMDDMEDTPLSMYSY